MPVLNKHAHTGRDSRDYLPFRIALAKELVGSFSGRRCIGRPCSLESQAGEIGHISWTLAGGCAGEAGLCGVFKGTGAGIDQESSKCMYLE